MKVYNKKYKNGLRIVFKKIEKDRPSTLFVYVKTGSINEDDKNNGISHLIEHLTFKGTEKRSAKDISIDFEKIGANANAYTGRNSTCFFATSLCEQMEGCFEILSDIIFNSTYKKEELEKEKKVIYEEIDMYQDDPESVAQDEFYKNFYFNTPLEKTILGTKEVLEKITKEDILEYKNKFYVPNNIIISVVGNFTFEFVEKMVVKYFYKLFNKNDIKNNELVDLEENCINRLLQENKKENNLIKSSVVVPDKKFSFIKKDIAQTQIIFGFPSDNIFSENRIPLILFSFIFGGGMGSRLFQKIREENGLVYSIYCNPEAFTIGGDIEISFGTNKKNQKKAVELIKEEIDKIVLEGIKEEELLRAKTFCKSLIVSSYELGQDLAKTNASNIALFNRVIPVEEKISQIENTTLDKINQLIKKVFNFTNVCGCVVSNEPDETVFESFN